MEAFIHTSKPKKKKLCHNMMLKIKRTIDLKVRSLPLVSAEAASDVDGGGRAAEYKEVLTIVLSGVN